MQIGCRANLINLFRELLIFVYALSLWERCQVIGDHSSTLNLIKYIFSYDTIYTPKQLIDQGPYVDYLPTHYRFNGLTIFRRLCNMSHCYHFFYKFHSDQALIRRNTKILISLVLVIGKLGKTVLLRSEVTLGAYNIMYEEMTKKLCFTKLFTFKENIGH